MCFTQGRGSLDKVEPDQVLFNRGCYSDCLSLAQSVSRTWPTPASGPQFPQVYVGWKIPKGASRFGDSLSLIQVDGSMDLSLLLGSEPAMVAGPS